MKVENDTNQPVDYGQSGGGGGRPKGKGRVAAAEAVANPCQSGTLPANGGNATFTPCGPTPWSVAFTSGNKTCSVGGITNAGVTVTLNTMNPCSISVS